MMQNRTHTCGELRLSDAGKTVKICGWLENVREVGAELAFAVVRDFYGTTQVVAETPEMVNTFKAITKESTISVEGTVREYWAVAATTSCPSRSTAAGRPTRPSGSSTAIWTCATPPSSRTSSCAARWLPPSVRP